MLISTVKIKMLNNKNEKRNTRIYTGLFVSCIIIIGAFVYRRTRQLNQKKEQLKKEAEILKNETELLKIQVYDKRFDEVVDLAKKNDSAFLTKFRELYPNFTQKLLEINPELENSELILCAMLKLNFSAKEISNYLFIQHKSAQQKKSRIRKRLGLSSDIDLYQFLSSLG